MTIDQNKVNKILTGVGAGIVLACVTTFTIMFNYNRPSSEIIMLIFLFLLIGTPILYNYNPNYVPYLIAFLLITFFIMRSAR
jgi:hypothetical protein